MNHMGTCSSKLSFAALKSGVAGSDRFLLQLSWNLNFLFSCALGGSQVQAVTEDSFPPAGRTPHIGVEGIIESWVGGRTVLR